MKRNAIASNPVSRSISRRHKYTKVCDNRKHPVRGLWQRNGSYFARLTVADDLGRKAVKWVPLPKAATPAEAQNEFRLLLVEREEGRLRHVGLSPLFSDYAGTYRDRLETSSKKPDTVVSEKGHIKVWSAAIGHLRLDKIRPAHITAHLHALRAAGKAARTCNLALVVLRNVLKSARMDGHLKTLPVDGLEWFKGERKAHRLYGAQEIDRLCDAAIAPRYAEGRLAKDGEQAVPLKNGAQFVDYLRFLQYTGAREQEALRVRWQDVDIEQGHVTVGAQGDSKNREARVVDMNPPLRALLSDMATRRAPGSWLFPSPQRGERDDHAMTFRESLLLARAAAGMDGFGFHDLRRHFASRCIMSGADVLTVSRWLGHKDGGILLLRSYAHLCGEHRKQAAQKICFAPTVLPAGQAVNS